MAAGRKKEREREKIDGFFCLLTQSGEMLQKRKTLAATRPTPAETVSPYMQTAAVTHVGLTVPNVDEAVKFYVNVLGGTEITSLALDNLHGEELKNMLFQVWTCVCVLCL